MALKVELAIKEKKISGKDLLIVNDIQTFLAYWEKINEEYTENHPKDYPFNYTEMSVIGSLVAAISRCEGMFSLIEFQTDKKSPENNDEDRLVYRGRGDLYFGRKAYGAVLEAKYPKSSQKIDMAIFDVDSHSSKEYNYFIALNICRSPTPLEDVSADFSTTKKNHIATIRAELTVDESKQLELYFMVFRSNSD